MDLKKQRENKAAGKKCENSQYLWHKVDGYCQKCRVHHESDQIIQTRRTANGYR